MNYKDNKALAFYGLPQEVKFCTKCVISNQRPSSDVEFRSKKETKKKVINFDEKNVCSACQYSIEKEKIDWKIREEKLIDLCKKIKKDNNGKNYD